MDEHQRQLIRERMEEIPTKVREAIENSNWERVVFDIGRSLKLHMDDIDAVAIETILTMTGLEHPEDFYENIKRETGIKSEDLVKLVEEINEKLFSKIREALQDYYTSNSEDGLQSLEKKVFKEAGISFGDEVETVTTMSSPQPVAPAVPVAKAALTPKPAPAPMPNVFETKTTKISAEGKPEGFFDPYRENIE